MSQRNKNKFKRSILLKWVYPYLAVFFVPLVLFLIFTATSLSITNKNVTYSNSLAVQFMRHEFDAVFSKINAVSDRLLVNSQFQRLSSVSSTTELDVMYLYNTTIELGQMIDNRAAIIDCMLYSPGLDVYFTSERWGDMEDLYLMDNFGLNWSDDKITQVFFSGKRTLGLENATCYLAGGCLLNRLLVVRPLSYTRTGWQHDFYVAFLVDVSSIFTGNLQDFKDLVIVNEISGDILYDFTNTYKSGEHVGYLSEIPSGKSAFLQGKMVTSGSSQVTNAKYLVMRDQKTYYHSLLVLLIFSLVYFVLALIAGFFVVRWRIKREWETYEQAMEATGALMDHNSLPDSTYSPFITSFSLIKEEKEGMRHVLRTQTESLKSHTIANLLDSSSGPVSSEALSECGIYLASDRFFVLLLVPGQAQDIIQIEEHALVSFQALSYVVLPFTSSHGVAFILNPSIMDSEDAYYTDFAVQVRALLDDSLVGILKASSSDMVTGLHKLGKAYLQAVNVLEYQRGLSSSEFMFYRDVVEMSHQVHFTYSTEQELRLSQAIQSGNASEAEAIIHEVLELNSNLGVSPQRMRYLLFSIASTIIRTANRLDERYKDVIPSISLPPILQTDDYRRSQKELGDILLNLCEAVLSVEQQYENATAQTYSVYRKALKHIDGYFADPMLNVSQIADNLGVSIVYLSRSFKQYHGLNISDYISQTRVLAAKKLLSEGSLVTDVVTLCGFGSLRTFMRVFKKEEHITPGQYRAMHMQEKI